MKHVFMTLVIINLYPELCYLLQRITDKAIFLPIRDLWRIKGHFRGFFVLHKAVNVMGLTYSIFKSQGFFILKLKSSLYEVIVLKLFIFMNSSKSNKKRRLIDFFLFIQPLFIFLCLFVYIQ